MNDTLGIVGSVVTAVDGVVTEAVSAVGGVAGGVGGVVTPVVGLLEGVGGILGQSSAATATTDTFPFLSVAPYVSSLAQMKHSADLVSLLHHRRAAVSSQL